MPVPSSITDLSATIGSNSPAGSDNVFPDLDNYLRAHAGFIAQLRDGKGLSTQVSVASAGTVDLGAQSSMFVEVTGTTTITSFGSTYNGPRFVRFAGALTLTHNATTLILPTGANITTEANQTYLVVPNSTTGWRVFGLEQAVSFLQAGTGAVTRTAQAKMRDIVSVKDFGAVGDGVTNDSTAFYNAAVAGAKVYVPAGTYLVTVLNLPSDTFFYGDGEASVIKPWDITARGALGCDSGSATAFITSLVFTDLKFLGTVVADGFLEFAHLLNLNGVKQARIENCSFVGFRGDGFYLGSGLFGGTERHNFDITVKNCVFDGVNNDNRNGLSVIDVNGMEVENCVFRNCAKSTMPGSVDFEPNASFSVIKNVRVINNKFSNTNGLRGHLVISTNNAAAGALENIIIRGNFFENTGTSSSILLDAFGAAPTNQQFILIEGNTSINPLGDFVQTLNGFYDGMIISGNTSRHLRGVWMSYGVVAQTFRNILITNNNFFGVGASSFNVLINGNAYNISIKGNHFASAGDYHVWFASGVSEDISINDNEFIGSPTNAAIRHTSSTKNALTNICLNNRFETSHTFEAARTDVVGGSNLTGADETTNPNLWPYGVSCVRLSNRTIDGASQTGLLYTYNQVNLAIGPNDIYQIFMPQYSATYRDDFYFRKATGTTTWDSWWQVTGV